MRHEMESGLRKEDWQTVPAWFIKEFRVFLNNEAVLVDILVQLYLKTRTLNATLREKLVIQLRFHGLIIGVLKGLIKIW